MKLTRRSLMALAVCGMFATAVVAHGPTRQKVELTIDIDAPADKVWARIGDFHDMSWHPAVAQTNGAGGNEVGASRSLMLHGDASATIAESLTRFSTERMSYSYKITEVDVEVLPVSNYSAHLTVMSAGDGKARVEWRGAFYRGFPSNDPPPELNDAAAIAAVTGIYQSGLNALKTEMETGG